MSSQVAPFFLTCIFVARSPPPASVQSGGAPQNRPFSPYRHAPTHEDLLNAAVRGRSLVIPPSPEKAPSLVSQSPSKIQSHGRPLSHAEGGKVDSQLSIDKQPSVGGSRASQASHISHNTRDSRLSP